MYNLNEEIGKRISSLRKDHHITQEELAENLDISIKHCSSVERGIACLSLERLIDVCDLFDISLDYLIRGESDERLNRVPNFIIEAFHNTEKKELPLLNEYLTLYGKIKNYNKKEPGKTNI